MKIVSLIIIIYGLYNPLFAQPFLNWSTYLGGSNSECSMAVATDASGNVYKTGWAISTSAISTPGSFQPNFGGGGQDGFLTKYDANGNKIWSTYFGGSNSECPLGIATDASGNVYITGWAISTSGISTPGSFQTLYGGGGQDGFLAKFNSNGNRIWSTYFGGSNSECPLGVSTDASGNVYITGWAISTSGISTPGSFQTSYGGGGQDGFLTKFNTNGNRIWSTYIGGANSECPMGVATDVSGNVIITGWAISTTGISTSGSFQPSFGGGGQDGFLSKFNTNGTRIWSTYLGGSNSECPLGVATDVSGNVFITGWAISTTGISTSGSFQPSFGGGGQDGFLSKFNTNGTRIWSTYIGGSDSECPMGVATDLTGNVIITGWAISTSGISTSGSFQPIFGGGGQDGFLTKFNTNGNRIWSTYFGGSNSECPLGIASDSSGSVYITGWAISTSNISSQGSSQPVFGGGGQDGFLAKFSSQNLGFLENEVLPKINVYPIPSSDKCNLILSDKLLGCNYYLIDYSGHFLKTEKIDSEKTIIDLSNFPSGIYFLKIGDDIDHTIKLIKE